MRKILIVFAVLLAACEADDQANKCNGFKMITSDEFQARVVSADDRYFTLYRTESECGYRYRSETDEMMLTLWDNCLGDWAIFVNNNPVVLCK